jgi:hypothetical protein
MQGKVQAEGLNVKALAIDFAEYSDRTGAAARKKSENSR